MAAHHVVTLYSPLRPGDPARRRHCDNHNDTNFAYVNPLAHLVASAEPATV